ncbi:MAG: Fe-S cluster assembly transcriptional regulator IscR [marine bacterium B5-7]|nr:MAG: Fe-S cluster assembly transcriptional regulator IscR [marine bacterium B5-7]
MRLTTKGRYAVTAMLDLAINQHTRPVTLHDIASNQEISLSYLEQLFARLRKSGLVKGTRGPGGGYRLAREPVEISIADIITSVDERIDITRCAGREDCHDGERCLTHELWADLSDKIFQFLDEISLGELIDRERSRVDALTAKADSSNDYDSRAARVVFDSKPPVSRRTGT